MYPLLAAENLFALWPGLKYGLLEPNPLDFFSLLRAHVWVGICFCFCFCVRDRGLVRAAASVVRVSEVPQPHPRFLFSPVARPGWG